MTIEQLAEKYHADELGIESAMLRLLLRKRIEPTELLVLALTLAVSFANMGEWEAAIPFETGDMTVREVIDEYDLELFLEEPWRN